MKSTKKIQQTLRTCLITADPWSPCAALRENRHKHVRARLPRIQRVRVLKIQSLPCPCHVISRDLFCLRLNCIYTVPRDAAEKFRINIDSLLFCGILHCLLHLVRHSARERIATSTCTYIHVRTSLNRVRNPLLLDNKEKIT